MLDLQSPFFNSKIALTRLEQEQILKIESINQDISSNLSIDKKIRYVHFETKEFNLLSIQEQGMHPLLIWSK